MANEEISLHQIKVFCVVQDASEWLDSDDIAAAANVSNRTARKYTRMLTDLGIFEEEKVFPGYLYRFSQKPPPKAKDHLDRLIELEIVFAARLRKEAASK